MISVPTDLLLVIAFWMAPAAFVLCSYGWKRARMQRASRRQGMASWKETVRAPVRPTAVDARADTRYEPEYSGIGGDDYTSGEADSHRVEDGMHEVSYAAANVEVSGEDETVKRRCIVCLN